MPNTRVQLDAYRVFFYSNEHEPRHVHVTDGVSEVVFELNCPDGPLELRDNFGFPARDVRWIKRALSGHEPALCQDWEGHFG